MTLQKFFYRNEFQYLERLRQTGPHSFELIGHTAEPYAGPYVRDLTRSEALRWQNGPEEVTRIE